MASRNARRAVLVNPHQALESWDGVIPAPGPEEVVLRVEFAGVCGTDVHLWHGEVPLAGPIVLGHEGIGVIEELGHGTTTDFAGTPVSPGDRVYWVPISPCHRCYYCTVVKDTSLCPSLFTALFRPAQEAPSNTYTEYAWLPPRMAFYRIPETTPSEAVIAFGCAMPTMLQGLERLGGIGLGQTVVIQGCGPVGLAATLLSHLSGAGQVIVVGAPQHRLAMARRLGATALINLDEDKTAEQRLQKVLDLTDGRGADVVIEAAGAVAAFAEGLGFAGRGGRYLIVGLWSAPGTVPVEPRVLNNANVKLIGTAIYEARHLYEAIRVATQYHTRFPLTEVVSHRFALTETENALRAVKDLTTIKAVIRPQQASM